jgi:hypothetical protein
MMIAADFIGQAAGFIQIAPEAETWVQAMWTTAALLAQLVSLSARRMCLE